MPRVAQHLIAQRGLCWILVLGRFAVLFYSSLSWRRRRVVTGEWGGEWSHMLLIRLISLYVIYQEKAGLARVTARAVGLGRHPSRSVRGQTPQEPAWAT